MVGWVHGGCGNSEPGLHGFCHVGYVEVCGFGDGRGVGVEVAQLLVVAIDVPAHQELVEGSLGVLLALIKQPAGIVRLETGQVLLWSMCVPRGVHSLLIYIAIQHQLNRRSYAPKSSPHAFLPTSSSAFILIFSFIYSSFAAIIFSNSSSGIYSSSISESDWDPSLVGRGLANSNMLR